MATDHVFIVGLVAASAAATLFAWSRIAQSADPSLYKLCLAFVAAIPLLGPVFWLFVASMPASRVTQSDLPFRGPVSPNPTRPLWAASWHKGLYWAAAVGVLGLHAMLLLAVLS
jgi:hypothetical protein